MFGIPKTGLDHITDIDIFVAAADDLLYIAHRTAKSQLDVRAYSRRRSFPANAQSRVLIGVGVNIREYGPWAILYFYSDARRENVCMYLVFGNRYFLSIISRCSQSCEQLALKKASTICVAFNRISCMKL
jgi:hypothetical protein